MNNIKSPTTDCEYFFMKDYVDIVADYPKTEQQEFGTTQYYYKKEDNGCESVLSITNDVYISAWYSFHAYGVSANTSFGDFNSLIDISDKENVINFYKEEYEVSDKVTFDRVFNIATKLKYKIEEINYYFKH